MMSKIITLTQSKEAIVDDDMFEYLNQWQWYYNAGYAVRAVGKHRHQKHIYMHREIMHTPDGMETDHINGNGLDNQRANLRACTTSQNQANSNKQRNNTSGYKGVCFIKRDNKWRASVIINKKYKSIGSFENPIDAAKAYDKKAKELFGSFARLNFPE